MIRIAAWLMVLYATAHTVGAFVVEDAARHVPAWFSGELWGEDFSNMSPAGSALWLTLASFAPPLFILGLLLLWLHRRRITPPAFVAWMLGGLTMIDGVINPFTPWPILLLASVLLLIGIRRAKRENDRPHDSVTDASRLGHSREVG
ncbi:DUF6463 family protein [Hoyosella altamirensis]|uniref:Uncharacterized protein n=1 Tax=Hoyosella altamirensis TaxID=616997 RepID=A0A839RUS7_9ACTN|nr:DUF6463 family protein [Hoyosella altamirensis]MBB3039978.1 hypothetical protein [Hoyosella altamirensis]